MLCERNEGENKLILDLSIGWGERSDSGPGRFIPSGSAKWHSLTRRLRGHHTRSESLWGDKIWDLTSNRCVFGDQSLFECYALSMGEYSPTFRRTVVPPSSGSRYDPKESRELFGQQHSFTLCKTSIFRCKCLAPSGEVTTILRTCSR